MESLLGLLVGLALVDTVVLAHLWCRMALPAQRRRREKAGQEAIDEESARRARAMDEGVEALLCYSVGGRGGVDQTGGSGE